MSEQEKKARLEPGWRLFDNCLYQASQAEADPELQVAQPGEFAMRRRVTVIQMSDHVPVWFEIGPGRLLVPRKKTRLACAARKARQKARKAKEPLPKQAVRTTDYAKSLGKPEQTKITMVCRQAIEGYFDERQAAPTGRVLPPILIVHGTHARLSSIDPQIGCCKESESFCHGIDSSGQPRVTERRQVRRQAQ